MRFRVQRLLHVLVCAPVAALAVAGLTPSMHAQAAATAGGAPAPYVVALDAGHGGSPDNLHPDVLFDPGTVGPNGLLEKDVALDMANRVKRLLEQDSVKVVLTRDGDVYEEIGPRMQKAVDAGAQLFVSIHMDGFQDPNVNGAVVLYPTEQSHPFADIMEAAIVKGLSPYGVVGNGSLLRDNLWVHATMPAVTLEPVYLTNPREADLMTRDDVRDALAQAIRDGIEQQAPDIQARHQAIAAWTQATSPGPSPAATAAPIHVGASGSVVNPVARATTASTAAPPATTTASSWSWKRAAVPVLLMLVLLAFRRPLLRLAAPRLEPLLQAVETLRASPWIPGARQRMRTERRRRLLDRSRTTAFRRALYDELWF